MVAHRGEERAGVSRSRLHVVAHLRLCRGARAGGRELVVPRADDERRMGALSLDVLVDLGDDARGVAARIVLVRRPRIADDGEDEPGDRPAAGPDGAADGARARGARAAGVLAPAARGVRARWSCRCSRRSRRWSLRCSRRSRRSSPRRFEELHAAARRRHFRRCSSSPKTRHPPDELVPPPNPELPELQLAGTSHDPERQRHRAGGKGNRNKEVGDSTQAHRASSCAQRALRRRDRARPKRALIPA